ncbi:heme oxygenase [Arctopsyche grandis]|uniref:heme oxygenase n=1 Tax=Arctopsyche grandis TaxID=121162 RepID=UPI00406D80FF
MSSFSTEMRVATRQPHALSDALANSKLAIALSDETVWADALLVFYEVFKRLEEFKEELSMAEMEKLFVDKRLLRASAFEKDLNRYLEKDWKTKHFTRPEVAEYLDRLNTLKTERPLLLLAYVYHLYLGLLSGGQIIRTKRKLRKFTWSFLNYFKPTDSHVDWVVEFGDMNIGETKKKIRQSINEIAENLNDEERLALLDESKKVFMYNNNIIKSVKGTNRAIMWKMFYFVLVIKVSVLAYLYLR